MDLTATQLDILTAAWATARDGNGIVLTKDAYPDAHELAEHGWLDRRFEPDGEMSWWRTPAAGQAFEYGGLMNAAEGPRELIWGGSKCRTRRRSGKTTRRGMRRRLLASGSWSRESKMRPTPRMLRRRTLMHTRRR
jgi:hypothetical protein